MAWADGVCVVDTRSGRIGRITGRAGPRLSLRPLSGGGRTWACPSDAVRAATEWEQRNADVLDANWRFWRVGSRQGGEKPTRR
ncbi:hypothetical protein [Streptomyces sp. NBC_01803]|uniref:hypothetical protein n=1 Tax=Streptomyces sp. NBC_01803 TaxID=2975946 RepID=UPI002DD88E14|nr:hypothetical protein [Streptomyces sp. NBC_01803]WSA45238.1 hypothetical protein OIE51_14075 [Streptomyces sp. NBC_01803]